MVVEVKEEEEEEEEEEAKKHDKEIVIVIAKLILPLLLRQPPLPLPLHLLLHQEQKLLLRPKANVVEKEGEGTGGHGTMIAVAEKFEEGIELCLIQTTPLLLLPILRISHRKKRESKGVILIRRSPPLRITTNQIDTIVMEERPFHTPTRRRKL